MRAIGLLAIVAVVLERLAALDARCALPAHGDPIEQPSAPFRGTIAHRLAREAKLVAQLGCVPIAVEALLPLVYGDVPAVALPLALLSLRAHVAKLVRDGRAAEHTVGIVLREHSD